MEARGKGTWASSTFRSIAACTEGIANQPAPRAHSRNAEARMVVEEVWEVTMIAEGVAVTGCCPVSCPSTPSYAQPAAGRTVMRTQPKAGGSWRQNSARARLLVFRF